MELVVNKTTLQLKEINTERRHFFVVNVLSNYNHNEENFDVFIEKTKQELEKTHNIKLSNEKVKEKFFTQFNEKLQTTIWLFLKEEDKKTIGTIENLDVEQDQIQKFIEFGCIKIKEYSDYVKVVSGKQTPTSEDIYAIYSYLSKSYGWTFDYIKDMDELQLVKALEQAILNDKKENVNNINNQALAASYASGNKKAKSQVDSLFRKLSTEINVKNLMKTNPDLQVKNELTREQMQKIMEGNV